MVRGWVSGEGHFDLKTCSQYRYPAAFLYRIIASSIHARVCSAEANSKQFPSTSKTLRSKDMVPIMVSGILCNLVTANLLLSG